MLENKPIILLQKLDPVAIMDRLSATAAEKVGGGSGEALISELLKQGEDRFLSSEMLTAVAVFSGQVSTALTMQRTFGEKRFKFPTEINQGATKTRIVFEYNLQKWREILGPTTLPNAHPRLKQVTIPILLKLKECLPLIFGVIEHDQSFPTEEFGELIETY